MTPLFRKLNFKDQQEITVLNGPQSFEAELKALAKLNPVTVIRDPDKIGSVRFALAFATTQAKLDALSKLLVASAEGDAILWFAYPKGTSKRYSCEFNRDSGWGVLIAAGFDCVRQVAIDEDWSALRFRRTEYIKTMTREPGRD
jgi:hypothetical protein